MSCFQSLILRFSVIFICKRTLGGSPRGFLMWGLPEFSSFPTHPPEKSKEAGTGHPLAGLSRARAGSAKWASVCGPGLGSASLHRDLQLRGGPLVSRWRPPLK